MATTNQPTRFQIVLFTDRELGSYPTLESAAEAWLELKAGNTCTDDLAFVRDRFGERVGEIVEVQAVAS